MYIQTPTSWLILSKVHRIIPDQHRSTNDNQYELKWDQVNQSEPKGAQMNPSELKSTQVKSSEKVNWSAHKWTQVCQS